jgi:hypothetical protein
MTLPSFCQTVTVTDSIICAPKSQLIKAIQDIKFGDYCKSELDATRKIVEFKSMQLTRKDSIILAKDQIELRYKQEILGLNELIDTKDDQINLYIAKARKERAKRIGLIAGGVTVTVGAVAAIIWLSL